MTAFTSVSVLSPLNAVGGKCIVLSATGPSSYDTGGSVIDLSVSTLGAESGLTNVRGVLIIGMGASGSAKFLGLYLAGASAALGKLLLRDLTAASDAEVTNATDLSTHTFYLVAFGS